MFLIHNQHLKIKTYYAVQDKVHTILDDNPLHNCPLFDPVAMLLKYTQRVTVGKHV